MDVDREVDFDDFETLMRQRAEQYAQLAQKQMSELSVDTRQLGQQMDEALKSINEPMEHDLEAADEGVDANSRLTTRLILVIALVVLVLFIKFIALMFWCYKKRRTNPSYLLDHSDLFLVCCPLYSLVAMSMQRSTAPGFYYAQHNNTGSDASLAHDTAAPLPPGEHPAMCQSATAYLEYPPSYDTARLLPADHGDSKLPPC